MECKDCKKPTTNFIPVDVHVYMEKNGRQIDMGWHDRKFGYCNKHKAAVTALASKAGFIKR
jgi:hypothetical protein